MTSVQYDYCDRLSVGMCECLKHSNIRLNNNISDSVFKSNSALGVVHPAKLDSPHLRAHCREYTLQKLWTADLHLLVWKIF